MAKAASVAVLVAEHQAEGVVAVRVVVPDLGRAVLGGVLEVDHRRQRLVVDLDQLGGVARLRQRLGDHEGDAVADEAHLVGNEQRLEGAVALGRAEILRHQMRGHGAELVGRGIGAGQHQQHAGRGLGLRHVDALDAGVGVRRQHGDAVAHARAARCRRRSAPARAGSAGPRPAAPLVRFRTWPFSALAVVERV